MKQKQLIPFLLFLISVLAPVVAYASGSVFDSSACNTLNIVTGTPGKVFAAFAVVATGVGFFTGKISWGLLIGVVGGIAVIFGAPSIVAAISGKPMFECQQGVQYVSDCTGSSCYSCPMGFTGEDCDECATGYEGINCDSCAQGYEGYNCSECDALGGYYSSGDYCYKACAVSFLGIKSGRVVQPTTQAKDMKCDADGFAGTISYSCIGETFTAGAGEVCGCEGNRGGANCDECQDGYDVSTDCTTLLPGYYDTLSGAQPECDVSAEVALGVDFVAVDSVLPLKGSLGCTVLGYDNQVNYTCEDGNFNSTGSCSCAAGYSGGISDCAASCDTSNNYTRDVVSGECKKGCDVSEPGFTTTWVDMSLVDEYLPCNSTHFIGDVTYTCDPDNAGFEMSLNTCECDTGYDGVDCLSCDAANGYSDDGTGVCEAGCSIDIDGSSAIWVSPTASTLQVPCDETNYQGDINYTCAANDFVTTDSCSCITGFDLASGCTACDSANGYNDDGAGGCVAGCDITGIDALISDSWVGEGSSTLTCQAAGDGFTRSLNVSCSGNSYSITGNSCTCPVGYTDMNCSSCDVANGYSMQSGVCKSGCYINMDGINANYWVNRTSSTTQVSCHHGHYIGTINYECDGVNFTTTDSCSCGDGYTLSSGCTLCDSSNNYNLISGSCQKSCDVPTNITDMQVPVVGYVVQGSGSLSCNASSVAGINNRSVISYACDANGNFSATQTTCACDAGYAGSDCSAIDTANGYVDDGSGNPILACDVSLTGISEISVILGSGSLTCRVGNYEGNVSYNCDSNRNLNDSGSCTCKAGYTGSNCTSCDSGYNMDGGICKQKCSMVGQTGLADTEVDSGSFSDTCDVTGYTGSVTYSCSDGSLTGVNNSCVPEACTGGSISNIGSDKIHVFNSGGTFSCSRSIDGVKILVVGGGGSGGDHHDESGAGGPAGGGGGGIAYIPTVTLSSGNYSVTVGNGGTGSSANSACSGLGANGAQSRFYKSGVVDARGYGGGGGNGCGVPNGNSGGSSGGSNTGSQGTNATKGSISIATGTTYGNKGGSSLSGGGGASTAGSNGTGGISGNGGNGGQGLSNSITGTNQVYGSGGGAGGSNSGGNGGTNAGNGHTGSSSSRNSNIDAVANKGGGGGSAGRNNIRAGDGGKGVVIIRYTND